MRLIDFPVTPFRCLFIQPLPAIQADEWCLLSPGDSSGVR